ncbi:unnamed protein product [Urochloa humidicola]
MPWSPKDVRQGRVLLECVPEFTLADALNDTFLRDLALAVCDPLFRRYVLLPPIPDDLTNQYERLFDSDVFLVPTGEDEEDTSFRVVCAAWNQNVLAAFVFTSITGQWSIAASPSWCSLGTGPPHFYGFFAYFDFARGCFYWTGAWINKLLVLDAVRMEFSIVNNKPSGNLRQNSGEPHVAVGEEGTPLMLFISDHNEEAQGDQLHVTKVNDSESSEQWQLENIIPLPREYRYFINGAEGGFIFLNGIPEKDHKSVHPWEEYAFREYFSLDVKTSELQKVCQMKLHFFDVHAYFGFPPSLSKPCI